MEFYKFCLPLYEEPSAHFKAFVNDFEKNSNYIARLTAKRLSFLPNLTGQKEDIATTAATLSTDAFKHPNARVPKLREAIKFATCFNVLSTLYAIPKNAKKCQFCISLIDNAELFPKSKKVLELTFSSSDEEICKTIDNHLKLIG